MIGSGLLKIAAMTGAILIPRSDDTYRPDGIMTTLLSAVSINQVCSSSLKEAQRVSLLKWA